MFMKTILKIVIPTVVILIISIYANGQSGLNLIDEYEMKLKESLKFEEWQISNKIINGINISNSKLSSLSALSETRPKNVFYISENKSGDAFVAYRSKWYSNDGGFIEVTMSILNSGYEAKEYLLDKYILDTTLPYEIKSNSIDMPKIVGDVSFFKGRLFIRNNIVVEVFAEGAMLSRIVKTSSEIDSLLIQQNSVLSIEDIKPRVVIDSNNVRKILE